MVAFVCPKCETVFTSEFEEYWQWNYVGGKVLFDNNGQPLEDKNGRIVTTKYEWKLQPAKRYGMGKPHTEDVVCPSCHYLIEINLTKKEFRHLRRPPPTEREITRDIKED